MSTERDPIFGCLLATGRTDRDGYAWHGKSRGHIVAWTKVNGPVPEGKVLDHMCRRRHCSAHWHLEPVTQSENEKRKDWRYRVRRATCSRGHDLKLHGQVTPERGIVCRSCNRELGGH